MTGAVVVNVPFCGTSLQGLRKDGRDYVALRPIVEGMGLDWASQLTKIKADEVLAPTVVEITTVAEDGRKRKMTCIPEEFLQGWLFCINPRKVRADLKERILTYKRECYRVLHQAMRESGTSGAALRVEYLAGHREMHDAIHVKAAESANERFVHSNVERRINKSVGIEAGQRGRLAAMQLSAVTFAQGLAAAAFRSGADHKEGYAKFKQSMDGFDRLLLGDST